MHPLSRSIIIIVVVAMATACSDAPDAGQGSPDTCSGLTGQSGDVVVTRASLVQPAPLWRPETDSFYQPVDVSVPLCRIEATIEGSIGLELWLPADNTWNKRLLAAGVGGPAGVFNYSDMSRRINEGFATFSTDGGHKASNTRWMADAKALEDYTHRATHLATVVSKQLAARYYGEEPNHSYFVGCSGGGRQALKEMQKYPGDFDGIVSGAPGPNMPLQSVRMMWFSLEQERKPEARLDDGDWDLYENRVTAACDAIDGVEDGVIENPLACEFDTASLLCGDEDEGECLTEAKVGMLDRIAAPMPDENGAAMDWGLVPGVRTRPGPPSPLLRALWADGVYDDPAWDQNSFERTRDLERVHARMPEMRADNVDIGPWLAQGGKTLIYQGWADPSTVAGPTLDYFRSLAAAHGGADSIAGSVRLFMVPGMYHCRRGPGADQFGGSGHSTWPGDAEKDILWSLIRWVEEGVAPESLVASKLADDVTRFTHRLCPFPQAAVLVDGRAGDSAADYVCADDSMLVEFLGGD